MITFKHPKSGKVFIIDNFVVFENNRSFRTDDPALIVEVLLNLGFRADGKGQFN